MAAYLFSDQSTGIPANEQNLENTEFVFKLHKSINKKKYNFKNKS